MDQSDLGGGKNERYFQVCELLFRPHDKTLALSVDMHFYVDTSDGANLTIM